MKEYNFNGHSLLVVEVPSMAFGFDINNYGSSSELMYTLDIAEITTEPSCQSDETLIVKPLPSGQWELLGRAGELSEEQWEAIIPVYEVRGRDTYYTFYGEEYGAKVYGSTDVMKCKDSFLRANKIGMNDVLLIKK